ncbi:MAG: cob(I)yrinic acid a,c-diamide adenosyltransferase [Anaerolineae bacterium]|nr:cob(I)yrinic acid a,c-diamide adenosyltransferase [Anaerolineae bacterium]
MKIYTRTGDEGETSLFAGGRVMKDDLRLHAYGTIDELNAVLGLAIALKPDGQVGALLSRIQSELFTLGADLATPLDAQADWVQRADAALSAQLEQEIDQFEAELPALKNFILPGGTPAAAVLHQARTVCRRAERWMVAMRADLNPHALTYVNRLSDWLFMLARLENLRAGVADVIWKVR